MWLFIERVTQFAERNLQAFWPITDKVPPLQEPPPVWGQRDVAMVTLKLYTSCLSQSVPGPGRDLLSKHTRLQTANVS